MNIFSQCQLDEMNISMYFKLIYTLLFLRIFHFSVGIVPDKKLKFLILGLRGSGKTEIAHYLTKTQRLDYDSTNGVHNYTFKLMETMCSLTEIGGNDDMQRIWHHYYVGVSRDFKRFEIDVN